MSRRIVVTSGKGGVGKTTVCVNLGYALAKLNLRVLLVDLDFGLNNLDVMMGIENKVVYDLIDCIEGRCRGIQAIVQDFEQPNLCVFPTFHLNSRRKIEYIDILKVIEEIEERFDYILFDSPAGIDMGFMRSINVASEAVVVTTPHLSAVRDADKVITIIKSMQLNKEYLVLNRARGDLILSGDMLAIESVEKFLNIDILGVIPEEDEFACQMLTGGAITLDCDAKYSFYLMANFLHNSNRKIFDCTKKYKGVLGNLRKKIKRIV